MKHVNTLAQLWLSGLQPPASVGGSATWGSIGGLITAQLDLTALLATYQPLSLALTNTTAAFTSALETKLNGISTGAEQNVNADWNAASGDAQILNKPTLGTAAAANAGDFATAGHNHTGTYQPLATVLTNTTAAFTTTQESKLAGIETGATADQTGAEMVTAINGALGGTTWQGGGGGGGGINSGTAEVDFGAFPGATDAVIAVAAPWVTGTSVIHVAVAPISTADHAADEHIVDPPRVALGAQTAGVGFDVHAFTTDRYRHHGRYAVAWMGA